VVKSKKGSGYFVRDGYFQTCNRTAFLTQTPALAPGASVARIWRISPIFFENSRYSPMNEIRVKNCHLLFIHYSKKKSESQLTVSFKMELITRGKSHGIKFQGTLKNGN
jgi:hypothetical protein